MPRRCAMCNQAPRENDKMYYVRVYNNEFEAETWAKVGRDEEPTQTSIGVVTCRDCKEAYRPIVAERLAREAELPTVIDAKPDPAKAQEYRDHPEKIGDQMFM
ncbi:MAG TPA: hypothetical protein VHC22_32550 [Pirellulales bacterium]|nr:hypothetical protein [Pirellulales bacterium]